PVRRRGLWRTSYHLATTSQAESRTSSRPPDEAGVSTDQCCYYSPSPFTVSSLGCLRVCLVFEPLGDVLLDIGFRVEDSRVLGTDLRNARLVRTIFWWKRVRLPRSRSGSLFDQFARTVQFFRCPALAFCCLPQRFPACPPRLVDFA